MMLSIAAVSRLTHIYMLMFIFAIMWSTNAYGYLTEELSPPDPSSIDKTGRHQMWLIRGGPFEKLVRLSPHLLGWPPYLTVWAALMHSFFSAASLVSEMPSWVHAIVVGQALIFSLFGITQFANQYTENGPSWYIWGEFSYLALSLIAKGFLGMIMIVNVLRFDSFDDAIEGTL
jgi:hypothetical protein